MTIETHEILRPLRTAYRDSVRTIAEEAIEEGHGNSEKESDFAFESVGGLRVGHLHPPRAASPLSERPR